MASLDVYRGDPGENAAAIYEANTHLVDPKVMLAHQSNVAKALMDVIKNQVADEKGNTAFAVKIGKEKGKDFLTFESWQFLARMNNCHVELEGEMLNVVEEGNVVAYGCYVGVYDDVTGVRRSRAYMECGANSFPTQGKQGREKVKAAQSAAQTWAAAKACRMVFSFVAVLAGYQPTTAEEMYTIPRQDAPPQAQAQPSAPAEANGDSGMVDSEVECPKHPGYTFVKTLKMRGFAHKDENGEWCNFATGLFRDKVAMLAMNLGWDAKQAGELSKELYGKTWSAQNPSEITGSLAVMEGKARELASIDTP